MKRQIQIIFILMTFSFGADNSLELLDQIIQTDKAPSTISNNTSAGEVSTIDDIFNFQHEYKVYLDRKNTIEALNAKLQHMKDVAGKYTDKQQKEKNELDTKISFLNKQIEELKGIELNIKNETVTLWDIKTHNQKTKEVFDAQKKYYETSIEEVTKLINDQNIDTNAIVKTYNEQIKDHEKEVIELHVRNKTKIKENEEIITNIKAKTKEYRDNLERDQKLISVEMDEFKRRNTQQYNNIITVYQNSKKMNSINDSQRKLELEYGELDALRYRVELNELKKDLNKNSQQLKELIDIGSLQKIMRDTYQVDFIKSKVVPEYKTAFNLMNERFDQRINVMETSIKENTNLTNKLIEVIREEIKKITESKNPITKNEEKRIISNKYQEAVNPHNEFDQKAQGLIENNNLQVVKPPVKKGIILFNNKPKRKMRAKVILYLLVINLLISYLTAEDIVVRSIGYSNIGVNINNQTLKIQGIKFNNLNKDIDLIKELNTYLKHLLMNEKIEIIYNGDYASIIFATKDLSYMLLRRGFGEYDFVNIQNETYRKAEAEALKKKEGIWFNDTNIKDILNQRDQIAHENNMTAPLITNGYDMLNNSKYKNDKTVMVSVLLIVMFFILYFLHMSFNGFSFVKKIFKSVLVRKK